MKLQITLKLQLQLKTTGFNKGEFHYLFMQKHQASQYIDKNI